MNKPKISILDAFLVIAVAITGYFILQYVGSFTIATFKYGNYECWIEKDMRPYTAFCVKNKYKALNTFVGELHVIDLKTGNITKAEGFFGISEKYFN